MSSCRIIKHGSSLGRCVEAYRFETVGSLPSDRDGAGESGFVPFLETIAGYSETCHEESQHLHSGPAPEDGAPPCAVEPVVSGIPEEEHLRLLKEEYERGFEEGKRQAERGLSSVFRSLREAVEEVAGLRRQILMECEEDLLKLAVMVARKVIHQEISMDRLILAKVVAAAVGSVSDRDEIVIRLNPEDHRIVTAHRQLYLNGFGADRVLELKADESIPPGGCIVDTAVGEIDARIDSQVDEIFRRLLEERNTLMSIPPKVLAERETYACEEN